MICYLQIHSLEKAIKNENLFQMISFYRLFPIPSLSLVQIVLEKVHTCDRLVLVVFLLKLEAMSLLLYDYSSSLLSSKLFSNDHLYVVRSTTIDRVPLRENGK